ncbi:DEAD/DEAH box helicase [Lichenicola sp.]|uniref:DEAD/DEAH box helicase n=1 Tax=Lichenicola sp. TaxID=2804529 RepID=UPI003B008F20
MTDFRSLGLTEPLLEALRAAGYDAPTPIQTEAIPPIMAGRDVQGIAQTGTGKTAAFALPILHRLLAEPKPANARCCRVLILSPTRELASQICDVIRIYARRTGLRIAAMVGGVPKPPQTKAVAAGIDILVATPGRLLDHLSDGSVRLDETAILVLDEADHMLDLGFIDDVQEITSRLPQQHRQTLLFSATMPPEIAALARRLLHKPVSIATTPQATTATGIEQRVIFVEPGAKRAALLELLKRGRMTRTLVFTRTKQTADEVVAALDKGGIRASAIHGDKSQPQRDRTLAAFRKGGFPVLVATDVAARGIDLDGITHVVNYDLPEVPQAYVHRIGRTARAGAAGVAITLCAASERPLLRAIEKLLGTRVRVHEARNAA